MVALGLLALAGSCFAAGIPGQGTWDDASLGLKARDINLDGLVDAYYDAGLNLTWLADANAAGAIGWQGAVTWAASLDVYGVMGWRLPLTNIAGAGTCDFSGAGGTDCGFKVSPDSSELAHMFYVTLGNKGFPDNGAGLSNTGPFKNLIVSDYWSGTEYTPDPTLAWYFYPGSGGQYFQNKSRALPGWAVHVGDVAVVPEPGTYALMLVGLIAVACSGRRCRERRRATQAGV